MRPAISLLLVLLTVTAGAGEIPDVLVDQDGPFWVAADVAVGPDGHVRASMLGRFSESVEWKALVAAESHSAECETYFGPDACGHFKATNSLDDLADADAVVTGRILAVRQGFFGGSPGSLLLIDATYLKGSEPLETYLFYPFARIEIAGGAICSKPWTEFVPPQPGDRLIIFSMAEGGARDNRQIFHARTDRELVHEHAGGVLLPDALRPHGQTFDAVLQAVTERLAITP